MTLNIHLNGSNYVSERTQAAFQEALEEPLPAPAGGNGQQPPPEKTPAQSAAPPAPPPSDPQHAERLLESLERGLSRSFEHQNETLQVHQQYLSNQAEYASIFSQLMAQQGDLFAHGNGSPQHTEATLTVLQSLARSIEQFHQHQTETLRVHNQFLSQQANYAEAYLHLLQGYADAPVPDGDGHGHGGNGYGDNGHGGNGHDGRSDHAGNGHDPAIATPQALSAVPAPSSAPPAPSQPSEPVASAPTPAPSAAPDPAPPAAPEPAPDPAPPAASEPALDAEALSEALLDIVSDKTGYPAEMLELDMDMEADLGIDSIKRVEILGALQDAHPHLPEVETEALAELRTLGQVVDYVHTARPEPTAKKV